MLIELIAKDSKTNELYCHLVEWLGKQDINAAKSYYSHHDIDSFGNEIVEVKLAESIGTT